MTWSREDSNRLAKVEQEQSALNARMDSFERGQQEIVSSIRDLKAQSAPQWPTYIAAASLCIVIGGAVLAPIYEKLNKFAYREQKLWDVARGAQMATIELSTKVAVIEETAKQAYADNRRQDNHITRHTVEIENTSDQLDRVRDRYELR